MYEILHYQRDFDTKSYCIKVVLCDFLGGPKIRTLPEYTLKVSSNCLLFNQEND